MNWLLWALAFLVGLPLMAFVIVYLLRRWGR
jgi:hypothetical protein